MKTTLGCLTLGVLAVLLVPVANAQRAADSYGGRPVASPALWQHHASTVQEGVFRGWADVNRSIGEARYNTALAAVVRQEAIRRQLENHKQAAYDFFELRRLNRDIRFPSAERPTQEELTRASLSRLPDRLTSDQYKPAFGLLVWPPVLAGEEFAVERQSVNRAMASRSKENSGVGSDNYRQIRDLSDRIEEKLKSQIDVLSPVETVAARKFLASLKYESRFPLTMDVTGLAAR